MKNFVKILVLVLIFGFVGSALVANATATGTIKVCKIIIDTEGDAVAGCVEVQDIVRLPGLAEDNMGDALSKSTLRVPGEDAVGVRAAERDATRGGVEPFRIHHGKDGESAVHLHEFEEVGD